MKNKPVSYFIYILRCADGTFYTGYTTDVKRRLAEHNTVDKGAKYTQPRRPVTLVHTEKFKTLGEALKREYEIKQLSRSEKIKLVRYCVSCDTIVS